MTQVSLIASLVTPLIGRTVISTDKLGTESRFTIARLADKIGTLKNGSKGEYVVLTKDGETGVVINLHPNTALKLAKTANADGFSLLMDLHGPVSAAELSDEEKAAVQAELAASQSTVVKAATEVKAPSKKSLTVTMFTSMTAEGKSRKDIISAFKSQLGLSAACCNTYYQNIKSGLWS